ncbi:MAG: cobalamin B12-binding domain-containing protein, partial [Candidatus Glassbacteria bacterium]|nr:cobalamin B12-binding domain-containing protein [Candidatus Glassbacteria bacterium]
MDQKAFLPLGLLYLAAYLKKNSGHQVEVCDLAGKEDELENALTGIDADLFGLTATTPQYPPAREILAILRSQKPGSKVVLGGVHATSAPETCKAEGWDHVVLHEGEQALVALANGLEEKREIPLLFQSSYISDIDTIPYPAIEMLDYSSYGYSIDGHKALTLITSR